MLDPEKLDVPLETHQDTLHRQVTQHLTVAMSQKGTEAREFHDWKMLAEYRGLLGDEAVV